MSSFLNTNEYLRTGEYMVADQGDYFAILQNDGDFEVYKGRSPSDNRGLIWNSEVAGRQGNYFAIMQSDGNLVVYQGTPEQPGPALWATESNTPGSEFYAAIRMDGTLAVFEGNPANKRRMLWNSGRFSLGMNEFLQPDSFLLSPSRQCFAYMHDDGTIVIYNGSPRLTIMALYGQQDKVMPRGITSPLCKATGTS